MKFEFDSMIELDDFLRFAGYEKSDTKVAGLLTAINETAKAVQADVAALTGDETVGQVSGAPATEAPPADKPKRRTKAQIAADEAAAKAAADEAATQSTIEAREGAAAEQAAQPTETVKDAIPPANKPDDAAAQAWINARAQELLITGGAADPHAHLLSCRKLIESAGHAWYPEAFRLIGAPANSSIANFNDNQRAHHLAAIEWMTDRPAIYKL